jgi:hypothetical protein
MVRDIDIRKRDQRVSNGLDILMRYFQPTVEIRAFAAWISATREEP